MSDVQRYAVITGAIGPTVNGGDYVKYTDYQAIEKELKVFKNDAGLHQHGLRLKIKALEKENERLRLERDMLALNPSGKEPCVFHVMKDGDVDIVFWNESPPATQRCPVVPSYYKYGLKENNDG